MVREFVTANLATDAGATTRIGSHCLLMAYAHVAHNCLVGDHVIIANAVQLAGYVTVEDWAIVGGRHDGAPVHPHRPPRHDRRRLARVTQDVAPFIKVAGSPPRLGGLNRIGLERRGFARADLRRAGARLPDPVPPGAHRGAGGRRRSARRGPDVPEVEYLARFAETSARGLTR